MSKLCACMGPMYGEPHCYCEMKDKGPQSFMDNNPVRKAAAYDSAQQWKKFMAEGGFDRYKKGEE